MPNLTLYIALFVLGMSIHYALNCCMTALSLIYCKAVCKQEVRLRKSGEKDEVYTDGALCYRLPIQRTLNANEITVQVKGKLVSCPNDVYLMLSNIMGFTLHIFFGCHTLLIVLMCLAGEL